jgi:hypothetical protein
MIAIERGDYDTVKLSKISVDVSTPMHCELLTLCRHTVIALGSGTGFDIRVAVITNYNGIVIGRDAVMVSLRETLNESLSANSTCYILMIAIIASPETCSWESRSSQDLDTNITGVLRSLL